ncbi:DUF3718 domain-containing protein [Pseudoalteromonas tunicata]|jgi:maltodextrin utilization protein YvdJ|uniref:Uncharacterized protein n=1 Tax=Pseudoalteromonas tunicata D2 TaxID=87626 RepID=A4C3U4_9GAMM|nr:DUF3718 domain-containing protein [Pseudoalteromonas tunicata]ATC96495.1 hypothetical protein PTUN_b0020 [Pseudoalteromonas tunicata]AXT33368.1 DUF3718 domain-containing protein [Pseudoalteromonas tunicata]EAR30226.1 hypothetical protein PTD2_01616 [Pseudoalteromonas tunicata D2]MDP4985620.1 DUF3718 domain-containing protein [Pseudoalteromonas tunicata]MDP5214467.1 DUF3718 domain-containing protein [Pseudoalteromonas tunicata]
MNKLARSIITLAAIAAPLSISYAKMDPHLHNALVETCIAVKSNSPMQLRNELKEYNLKVDTIREKLMCNGESVHKFALTHNANRTAKFINRGSVSISELASLPQEKYSVWID